MDSNELLITLEEIAMYERIPANYNTANQLLPQILNAQRYDVAQWLGNEQYLDLWTNKTAPNYDFLLKGGVYAFEGKNYQLFGLKAFIARQVFMRVVRENDLRVTASGNVQKNSDESEAVSIARTQNHIAHIENRAMADKDNIKEYLCRKHDEYPLYRGCIGNPLTEDKGLGIHVSYGRYGKLSW